MRKISVKLTKKEWDSIIERVEDDDFYWSDRVAQRAIKKIKDTLVVLKNE